MATRDEIVAKANWWAEPGGRYKPTPDDIVRLFMMAGVERGPSLAEAAKSLKEKENGILVGGTTKHWCGIFAAAMIRDSGVDARWSLLTGKIVGLQFVFGRGGMQPGDVAIIPSGQHHFMISHIAAEQNTVWTVEGNTRGQYIKVGERKIEGNLKERAIYGYYKLPL